MFDGNSEAGVCKLVEGYLAVAVRIAPECIRTRAFVKFGSRTDAILDGRKSFLVVVVVVGIAIDSGAVVPSGLTMK